MRIIILGTSWPYRGGLASFNERLAQQFMSEGNEVELFTFTLQYPSFIFPGKTQYSDDPQPKDLKITRSLSSVNPFSWSKTAQQIAQLRPDLLVIKFWQPMMAPCLGAVARKVKKLTNNATKVVSILDNVIPHEHHFWDRFLIKYFIKSVDHFVAMSDSVKKDCEKFSNKKQQVALCPHPLYDNFGELIPKPTAREKLGLEKNTLYYLFFGFIRDYKGLDLLMHAFADERLKQKNVRLLVAGEFYNNAEQYARLEEKLGLKGRILWHTHFIPNEDVKYYFSACDLVVQPYKSATQSGVTQVAYHFNKPMLVTNVGGLAEIVPNQKVGYVTRVMPKDIADALLDFCEKGDVECFQNGILEEKKKYTWSNMTQTICNLQLI